MLEQSSTVLSLDTAVWPLLLAASALVLAVGAAGAANAAAREAREARRRISACREASRLEGKSAVARVLQHPAGEDEAICDVADPSRREHLQCDALAEEGVDDCDEDGTHMHSDGEAAGQHSQEEVNAFETELAALLAQEESLRQQVSESEAACTALVAEEKIRLERQAALHNEIRQLQEMDAERVCNAHNLIEQLRFEQAQRDEVLDEGPVAAPPRTVVPLRSSRDKASLRVASTTNGNADAVVGLDAVPDERRTLPVHSLRSEAGLPPRSPLAVLRAARRVPTLPANRTDGASPAPSTSAKSATTADAGGPVGSKETANTANAVDDPAIALQTILHEREDELAGQCEMLQAARIERRAQQQICVEQAVALHRERERTRRLRGDLEKLRVELVFVKDHAVDVEDADISMRNQIDSLSKQQVLLKEQLASARDVCAELQSECDKQANAYGETFSQYESESRRQKAFCQESEARTVEMRQKLAELSSQQDAKNAMLRSASERIRQLDTEERAVRRVAELIAEGIEQGGATEDARRTSQRRLLASLHPDKCPAARIATLLTQEVQNTRSWLA